MAALPDINAIEAQTRPAYIWDSVQPWAIAD